MFMWTLNTSHSEHIIRCEDLISHAVGKGRFSYPDGSYFEGELGNGRRVHGQFVSGARGIP